MKKSPSTQLDRWLLAVGILKLLKAVLFVSMGVGVIKLLHQDVADVLQQIATALRFDTENHAVNVLLEKASSLDPHRLKQISFALFLYAGLDVIEGIGLILKKEWAEYLTLILTTSFLPWEIYEILRHITTFKVALTVVNFIVVVYLALVVRERIRRKRAGCGSG